MEQLTENEAYHRQAMVYLSRLAVAMAEAHAVSDPQYPFLEESYRQAQTNLQLHDLGRVGSHFTVG